LPPTCSSVPLCQNAKRTTAFRAIGGAAAELTTCPPSARSFLQPALSTLRLAIRAQSCTIGKSPPMPAPPVTPTIQYRLGGIGFVFTTSPTAIRCTRMHNGDRVAPQAPRAKLASFHTHPQPAPPRSVHKDAQRRPRAPQPASQIGFVPQNLIPAPRRWPYPCSVPPSPLHRQTRTKENSHGKRTGDSSLP